MDKKFDTTEIANPKKTLRRREEEAGSQPAPAPAASQPKGGGIEFFNGNRKPATEEQKRRRQKQLEELLRKRDRELQASNDEFEESFRADSGDPLTDAVRAARREAGAGLAAEDQAYSKAYNEDRMA